MKISYFVHSTVWLRVLFYSKFWNCEWNPIVWPFKWNLFSITFARKKRTAKCLCVTNVTWWLCVCLTLLCFGLLQTDQFKFGRKFFQTKLNFHGCHTGFTLSSAPGGGGTLLYKLYRYVPRHRVGSLRRFGLTTGIHFAHFGLESGMAFEGTAGVYERIYRFNSKWVRKKEKYANLKRIWIFFLFAL